MSLSCAVISGRLSDAHETGPFEKRIHVPHLRQGFDPRPRAEFATAADERSRDSRSAIDRMQHHPGEIDQLAVERLQLDPRPASRQSEVTMSLPQRQRRASEQTDADRPLTVP